MDKNISVRKSDKCSKEDAKSFMLKVKQWCDNNKIPYKKIKGLTSYEGEVRLYNGLTERTIPQRRSRKLIAYRNDKGEWEGDLMAVEMNKGKGDALYSLDYHSKKIPMYTSVFKDEWSNPEYLKDEQRAIRNFFGEGIRK